MTRRLVGFEMQDRYTVRNGYAIYKGGKAIGKVQRHAIADRRQLRHGVR